MEFRLALVGNPNVGKSTIFNILTGLHQHVGNWPGKTVEKKEGVCHFDGRTYYLIDLPGTYSLTANSIEEIIARDYIVQERPDVVIAIVDASNLERNLYLVTELLELTPKVIVALNMLDLAQSKGYEIEVEKLQAALGVPVVPVIAVRAQGIRELLETAAQVAQGEIVPQPASIDYEMIVGPLRQVEEVLQTVPSLDGYPRRWVALKLLEGDGEAQRLAERVLGEKALARLTEVQKRTEDAAFHLAHARYAWIEEKLKATLKRPPRSIITLTDRLDHLFTHRFLGLPILLSLFGVIFGLTFTLAAPLQDWIDAGFNRLSEGVRTLLAFAPTWLTDLLTEGVIAGVGSVLTFFPVLIIFFFFLALLEDSGYLARAAFVMDRLMHLLGLHGKTFLSLLIAYGCNIPGIMATRILEEERDRILTILILPLIPCVPRLGVAAFFAAAFFAPGQQVLVMLSLLALSLLMVVLAGFVLRRVFLPGERAPFIMELPLYRCPNWRNVGLFTWLRTVAFLHRAGTVIVAVSIVLWALSYFPLGAELPDSYLGQMGRALEPVGRLLGLDWRMTLALLTGFPAKETALATIGVIYHSEGEMLAQVLRQSISPLVAYVFMVLHFLYIPCLATVAVIYRETNRWQWAALAVLYPLLLSSTLGALIFHLGRAWGWG